MFEYQLPLDATTLPIRKLLQQVGISLTLWRKIKREGSVYINGVLTNDYRIIKPGDTLVLHWPQHTNIKPYQQLLSIAYEDDDILVVDKPAGLLVHPTGQETSQTLANLVIHYYASQNQPYGFHPVSRLDRNTSGLVLIAKQPYIHYSFAQKNNTSFQRSYLGLVTGILVPANGIINLPIGRKTGSIIEREIRDDGQSAITNYKVVSSLTTASLLELSLETGRTHQIRVHLADIGHPIIGDDLYGKSDQVIKRQALHAYKLQFNHPRQNRIIILYSPLPTDIRLALAYYAKLDKHG